MRMIAVHIVGLLAGLFIFGCGAAADTRNAQSLEIVKPQAASILSCDESDVRATCVESHSTVGHCIRWGMAGCKQKAIYNYDEETKKWVLDPEIRPASADKPDESSDDIAKDPEKDDANDETNEEEGSGESGEEDPFA